MIYDVILHRQSQQELDSVPQKSLLRIHQVIRELQVKPYALDVRGLDERLHRIRIGEWRVIYVIRDSEQRVVVLRVVRRSEKTYRRLP